MKLLYITHNFPYPPEKDGYTLISYHVLIRLAARHQITLYCFSDQTDTVNEHIFTDVGIKVKMFRRPRHHLWSFYLTGQRRRWTWLQYRLYDPTLADAITQADESGDYDLIHMHSPGMSLYLPYIQYSPRVCACDDAMSTWFNQFYRQEKNPLKKLHYLLERNGAFKVERETYPRASAMTVVSDVDRDIILAHSPSARIVTVPNGVDLKYFRPSETAADQNLIVFSGTMNYPPNVRAVLDFNKDAWPRLKAAIPDLRWLVVGKNPTLDIFDLQSRDQRISVTGYVKDLRTYLWQSTVFVCPLNFGTGFKNKIIEAMACGKAIVGSPTSLSGFPVTDGENVMIARTPTEFIEKTLRVLRDPELRRRLEIGARRFAERYSWSRTADAYEQLFQQIVDTYSPKR